MTKENILPLVPIFLILIFNEYKKNNIKKFIICSLLIFLPLSISLIPYGESALNTFLKVYPLHKTDTFGIKLNTFEKVYTPSFSVSLNILLYILFAYYLLKNNKKLNYFLESSLFVLTIFYTLGMPSIWWAVLLIPLIFIFGEKNNFFLEYILLSTIFTIELYVNYVGNIDLSSPVGSLMKWLSFIIRPNILLMFENFYTILLTTKMAIGIIFLIKTLDYIFIKDKSVDK